MPKKTAAKIDDVKKLPLMVSDIDRKLTPWFRNLKVADAGTSIVGN